MSAWSSNLDTTSPTVSWAPTAATSRTITVVSWVVAEPELDDPPPAWANRSRDAHAELVARSRARRPDPPAVGARRGFAQMARLPCYRSTRVR